MSRKDPQDQVGDIVTQLIPAGAQLSFGALCGYASGFTLRAGGKIAGALLGGGFMFIQSLSYLGYIEVDWRGVEQDYFRVFDRNGDGKISRDDVKILVDHTSDVLKFNLPAGSGFTAGFAYGLTGSLKYGLAASALYPLGTGAAVGSIPMDFLQTIIGSSSSVVGQIQNSDFLRNLPKQSLEDKLNRKSLDELRQIEFELKHNVTLTKELLGLEEYSKDEILDQVESSKKFVKRNRAAK